MKLRHKTMGHICTSHGFNTASMSEIIVGFPDDGMDSDYISNFDVQLRDGSWKDLGQAFKDRDVVPNNLNTSFWYPSTEAARQRGWND